MTVEQLRDELSGIVEDGFGAAVVIIEEEGEGYFGDLKNVDTLLTSQSGASLTLLGTAMGQR